MHWSVENQAVVLHKFQILQHLWPHLVLVALRLVLNVLQANGSRNYIPIISSILLSYLIVEQLQSVLLHKGLYNVTKDLVQCLIALLLSFPLWPVILKRLLVVEVFFSEPVCLEPAYWWLLLYFLWLFNRLFFDLRVVVIFFWEQDFKLFVILFWIEIWLDFKAYRCFLRLWVFVRVEIDFDDWLGQYLLLRLFAFHNWH